MPGVQVFDTVSGKVVGELVKSDELYIMLSNPGLLEFQNVPGDTGTTIKVIAVIRGWLPYTEVYALARAGLRGKAIVHESWIVKLYENHVAKVKAGAFKLNPFETSTVELKPGEGHTELTGAEVVEVKPVQAQASEQGGDKPPETPGQGEVTSSTNEPVTTPNEGANG